MKAKTCKKCKQELPLLNFWKQPNNKDGYFGKCKVCALELNDINALSKQLLLEQNIWACNGCKKELILSKQNFHIDCHTSTGFRLKCKECIKKDRLTYTRTIKKDDLDCFLKDVFVAAKGRALKKKLKFDISIENLKFLWDSQKGKCAIANINMTHTIKEGRLKTNLSIDRIDSTKGYTTDNIQLVCVITNIMKSTMTMNELLFFCKQIIKNNKK